VCPVIADTHAGVGAMAATTDTAAGKQQLVTYLQHLSRMDGQELSFARQHADGRL
jgi:hypothetical protein